MSLRKFGLSLNKPIGVDGWRAACLNLHHRQCKEKCTTIFELVGRGMPPMTGKRLTLGIARSGASKFATRIATDSLPGGLRVNPVKRSCAAKTLQMFLDRDHTMPKISRYAEWQGCAQ